MADIEKGPSNDSKDSTVLDTEEGADEEIPSSSNDGAPSTKKADTPGALSLSSSQSAPRRPRIFWLAILTLIVFVALALGLGLGLQKGEASSSSQVGGSQDTIAGEGGSEPNEEEGAGAGGGDQEPVEPATDTEAPSAVASSSPTPAPTTSLQALITNYVLSSLENCADRDELMDRSTVQHEVMTSLVQETLAVSTSSPDRIDIPIEIGPEYLAERFALGMLYETLGGQDWVQADNWRSEADVCDWFGVDFCLQRFEGSCAVLMLDLDSNNLKGEIPKEICCMPCLRSLSFRNNGLFGQVPACMASMNLDIFDLTNNPYETPEGMEFASNDQDAQAVTAPSNDADGV